MWSQGYALYSSSLPLAGDEVLVLIPTNIGTKGWQPGTVWCV